MTRTWPYLRFWTVTWTYRVVSTFSKSRAIRRCVSTSRFSDSMSRWRTSLASRILRAISLLEWCRIREWAKWYWQHYSNGGSVTVTEVAMLEAAVKRTKNCWLKILTRILNSKGLLERKTTRNEFKLLISLRMVQKGFKTGLKRAYRKLWVPRGGHLLPCSRSGSLLRWNVDTKSPHINPRVIWKQS